MRRPTHIAAPGPFRRSPLRSPLRGPWLTSVLGAALLAGLPIVAVTGLLSYAVYEPALGRNNLIGDPGPLDFYVFSWPTSPSWPNGADLSADHGFPARIIVPALPGVHCTKWVRRLEFRVTRA